MREKKIKTLGFLGVTVKMYYNIDRRTITHAHCGDVDDFWRSHLSSSNISRNPSPAVDVGNIFYD